MFLKRTLELIKETGINKHKLTTDLKINKNSFVDWEKGREPKYETISKIAAYFNVSVDYLTGKTNIKKPAPTNGDELLSPEEIEYLKVFRAASPEKKKAMLLLLGGDK